LGTQHEDAATTCKKVPKGIFPGKCGATLTLVEIQRLLGHRQIDLFKIDIEGYEWPMFEAWPELKAIQAPEDSAFLPMQVLVEIHYRTSFRDLWKPNQTDFRQAFKSPFDVVELQRHLLNIGYAVIERDDNRLCNCCTELTLLRTRCPFSNSTNSEPHVQGTETTVMGVDDHVSAVDGASTAVEPKDTVFYFELGKLTSRHGFGSLTIALIRLRIMYQDSKNAKLMILDERGFGNYRRNATHGIYKGFLATDFPVIDVGDNVTKVLEHYRTPEFIKISMENARGWNVFMRQLQASKRYFKDKYHTTAGAYGAIKPYACMIRYNEETQREIDGILNQASIPRFDDSITTVSFHIRRGDKIKESRYFETHEYVDKLVNATTSEERAAIQYCYVATDDYDTVAKIRNDLTDASISCRIHTLSLPDHDAERNARHAVYLFADLYMLTRGTFFVGSFNSNIGRMTSLWRSCRHERDESANEANQYHHFYRSYDVSGGEWLD